MEGPKSTIRKVIPTAGEILDSGKEIMAKQVLELIEEGGVTAEQKVERIRALVKSFIPQQ